MSYPMVRAVSIAAACVAAGALRVIAAAGEPPPSATPRPPEAVYHETCGYCHGRNVGPIILGRHLPVAYTRERVRAGVNAMPAFRSTEISDVELSALAAFVESTGADPGEKGK